MKDLSIPEKITLEREIAPGIRFQDIPKFAAIAVPGLVIGIIVWASCAQRSLVQLIALIVTFIYLFLCYVLVAHIDGSQSILGYIELLIRFHREQQHFYYKQGKEYLFYVETARSQENDSASFHQR